MTDQRKRTAQAATSLQGSSGRRESYCRGECCRGIDRNLGSQQRYHATSQQFRFRKAGCCSWRMLRVGSARGEHGSAPDCLSSRWGQVYILDSLLTFTPQTSAEAEQLGERLSIRLQHANSAVVLTTIKLLLYLMNYMEDESFIASLERKMGPPLGKP